MKYQCPVCGYPDLPRPPVDDMICACCGTHFGYHDYGSTYQKLRSEWIARGAQWFSRGIRQPAGWDAMRQLADARMLLLVRDDHAPPLEQNTTKLEANYNEAWTLEADQSAAE